MMTKHDITLILASSLRLARDNGLTPADVDKLAIYDEYTRLKAQGQKVTAIVYDLSLRYELSESKVYAYIRKMKDNAVLDNVF